MTSPDLSLDRLFEYQYEKIHVTDRSRVIHDGIRRLFQEFTYGCNTPGD